MWLLLPSTPSSQRNRLVQFRKPHSCVNCFHTQFNYAIYWHKKKTKKKNQMLHIFFSNIRLTFLRYFTNNSSVEQIIPILHRKFKILRGYLFFWKCWKYLKVLSNLMFFFSNVPHSLDKKALISDDVFFSVLISTMNISIFGDYNTFAHTL